MRFVSTTRLVGMMRLVGTIGKYLPLLLLAAIPFVGQIILTILILQEYRARASAVLWILVVWIVPYLGACAYLVLGNQGVSRVQYRTILLVLACIALLGVVLEMMGWVMRL